MGVCRAHCRVLGGNTRLLMVIDSFLLLAVVVLFVHLPQAGEEGTSVRKMPPLDLPVNKSGGHFLNS